MKSLSKSTHTFLNQHLDCRPTSSIPSIEHTANHLSIGMTPTHLPSKNMSSLGSCSLGSVLTSSHSDVARTTLTGTRSRPSAATSTAARSFPVQSHVWGRHQVHLVGMVLRMMVVEHNEFVWIGCLGVWSAGNNCSAIGCAVALGSTANMHLVRSYFGLGCDGAWNLVIVFLYWR